MNWEPSAKEIFAMEFRLRSLYLLGVLRSEGEAWHLIARHVLSEIHNAKIGGAAP